MKKATLITMEGSDAQISAASGWLKPKINELINNFTGTNITPIKNHTERLKNGEDIPLTRDSSRNTGISIRVARYSVDNPEEVSYTLGKFVKFIVGNIRQDLDSDDESLEEPDSEAELTFRQQISRFVSEAKPVLVQVAKEIWYSKQQLKDMQEGKKVTGRISTGSVKFDKPKEIPA